MFLLPGYTRAMTDSLSTSVEYEQVLELAMRAMAADDSATAIAALEQASRLSPEAATPSFLLGAEYARLGRMEDAEHAFTLAVVQDPSLHVARFQLGLLHLSCGRPAHAVLAWQGLDSLPAAHALRLFSRGLVALSQDRFADARADLERGIAANSENPALNIDMRMVLEKIATLEQNAEPRNDAGAQDHFLVSTYGRSTVH